MAEREFEPWFKRYPEIWILEAALMSGRGFQLNQRLFVDEEMVEFEGPSQASSHTLRIIYPDGFPSVHPIVQVASGPLLSRHQRADTGDICVFGFDERTRWNASMTGADALNDAESYVRKFGPTGDAQGDDDSAPEPVTDVFPYNLATIVLIPEVFARLGTTQTGTVQLLKLNERQIWFSSARMKNGQEIKSPIAVSQGQHCYGEVIPFDKPPRTREGILANPLVQHRTKSNGLTLVGFDEPAPGGSTRPGYISVLNRKRHPPMFLRTEIIGRDEFLARTPGLRELEPKKVLMVGLGSLGSYVARLLAQAGVTNFFLIDPDRLTYANLVRHQGRIDMVGAIKCEAAAATIREINPAATFSLHGFRVGSAKNRQEIAALVDGVEKADLIIETTGVHMVARYLNELSFHHRKAMVSGSVTKGLWGGEIARIIPGTTACYNCLYNMKKTMKETATEDPSPLAFMPGCSQPTFLGAALDEVEFAGAIARSAVELLLPGTFPGVLPGLEVRNIRNVEGKYEPRVVQLPIPRDPTGCYVCGNGEA